MQYTHLKLDNIVNQLYFRFWFFFEDIVQESEESGREARLILGNTGMGRIREKNGEEREKQEFM